MTSVWGGTDFVAALARIPCLRHLADHKRVEIARDLPAGLWGAAIRRDLDPLYGLADACPEAWATLEAACQDADIALCELKFEPEADAYGQRFWRLSSLEDQGGEPILIPASDLSDIASAVVTLAAEIGDATDWTPR